MLEIRKTVLSIEEHELIELQRIIIDGNEKDALKFLKKSIYEKIAYSQQGKLKSHLNGEGNPLQQFKSDNK